MSNRKSSTKAKAEELILDSDDERLRTVARHLAYILSLDATPADVHNHLNEYIVGLQDKYLNFIKNIRPDEYAEHLFHVLKFHVTAKGAHAKQR